MAGIELIRILHSVAVQSDRVQLRHISRVRPGFAFAAGELVSPFFVAGFFLVAAVKRLSLVLLHLVTVNNRRSGAHTAVVVNHTEA